MELEDRLKGDINAAMKSGDRSRAGALRLVLSEVQKDAKEGAGDPLAVLRRERKRRLEAAEQFRDAGRPELAEPEDAEAELISCYLPEELDDGQLREIVQAAIESSGAKGPADIGSVMKEAMAAADGRADGKRVSGIARELLDATTA